MSTRKVLIVISIIALLIGATYKAFFTRKLDIPKEINLNSISLSDRPTFNFSIKNLENVTVKIARIYTSCGCTSVVMPTTSLEVKSGASEKITVQFDPSSMHKSGDNVYHEIYILVTSPIEKEYMVKMKGKIR